MSIGAEGDEEPPAVPGEKVPRVGPGRPPPPARAKSLAPGRNDPSEVAAEAFPGAPCAMSPDPGDRTAGPRISGSEGCGSERTPPPPPPPPLGEAGPTRSAGGEEESAIGPGRGIDPPPEGAGPPMRRALAT